MKLIKATATHSDGWWVAEFSIDGRTYGTQAKRIDKLEDMIFDAATLMTGQPETEFEIELEMAVPQFKSLVDEYRARAEDASRAEQVASETSRRTVKALRKANLSMRDIGALMGISPQRVSQLAKQ